MDNIIPLWRYLVPRVLTQGCNGRRSWGKRSHEVTELLSCGGKDIMAAGSTTKVDIVLEEALNDFGRLGSLSEG